MANKKKSSATSQEAPKVSKEQRKDLRRSEQEARHQANLANPASTPWATARAARLARRAKAREEAV